MAKTKQTVRLEKVPEINEQASIYIEDSAYDMLSFLFKKDYLKIQKFTYDLHKNLLKKITKEENSTSQKLKIRYGRKDSIFVQSKIKNHKTVFIAKILYGDENATLIAIRPCKNLIKMSVSEIENDIIEDVFNLKSDHKKS